MYLRSRNPEENPYGKLMEMMIRSLLVRVLDSLKNRIGTKGKTKERVISNTKTSEERRGSRKCFRGDYFSFTRNSKREKETKEMEL